MDDQLEQSPHTEPATEGAAPHRIGITGHRALRDPDTVRQAIRDILTQMLQQHPDAIACTALAPGADMIFAQVALDLGMPLEVVVPFPSYSDEFATANERENFQRLLGFATVYPLNLDGPSEDAYVAAGAWIIERSQLLLAVWDGEEGQGVGGTADVVARARAAGRSVRHIQAARAADGPTDGPT